MVVAVTPGAEAWLAPPAPPPPPPPPPPHAAMARPSAVPTTAIRSARGLLDEISIGPPPAAAVPRHRSAVRQARVCPDRLASRVAQRQPANTPERPLDAGG